MQETLIALTTYCAILGISSIIAIITTIIIMLYIAYKEKYKRIKKGE